MAYKLVDLIWTALCLARYIQSIWLFFGPFEKNDKHPNFLDTCIVVQRYRKYMYSLSNLVYELKYTQFYVETNMLISVL